MFGTMGFSEVIIILVIVLIIFGAGKLPQIGEGIGKALKGFKKEVHEVPPPDDPNASQDAPALPTAQQAAQAAQPTAAPAGEQGHPAPAAPQPAAPYQPGPEATPGTTAAMMYAGTAPQKFESPQPRTVSQPVAPAASASPSASPHQPPTMEERMAQPAPSARASYPAVPPSAQPKPGAKRPSAVVNKDAVARVQAQQAARKQAEAQKKGTVSSQDMQGLGEGLGDALRTFRQAAADVKGAIEPEVRTFRNEMDSAQKEIEQSVEAAKQIPAVQEDPPQSSPKG